MQAIRDQTTADATAARGQIPAKYAEISAFMTSMNADPSLLGARFAVASSDTEMLKQNVDVSNALERTQSEISTAISTFSTIELWLRLSLPAIEDGNNFGVGIVMEGAKIISESKKELSDLMKTLPDYFKDRSAAAEKLSPKVSVSTSETTSKSADKELKGAEETTTSKDGTSTSSKKDTSSSTVVPDAIAHVVALDVNWYLKLHASCDRVRNIYATVCDFLEKNEARITEPKGSGGRMSMY
jgi:hypothetical protein